VKTKEQYLEDLKKGAERSLVNEIQEENQALLAGVRAFLKTPDGYLLSLLGTETSITYAFVAGTMAQKKESQKVISTLVELCAQFSDLFSEIDPQLNDEQVQKFEMLMQNFIDCKLDYIPFKGE